MATPPISFILAHVPSRKRTCLTTLVALAALTACSDVPTVSPAIRAAPPTVAPALSHSVFTSGSHVDTWDPIIPAAAYANWGVTICTNTPAVGLDANWQNPHKAFVLSGHPWAYDYFVAPWINAWNYLASVGPGGHNWTKYQTQVSGNGTFVIRLLADNCSWIYLDGILVGVQGTNLAANSYGLTLNGEHTLTFIIFDGGGAAGGKFILETTSTPPPPLNPDLDGDGYDNDVDAFPLDPTRWSLDSDGDGVNDDEDAFDNSDTGATVVIGSCNSGVANRHLGDGTWFADLIGAAKAAAANHGEFVRAVAKLADGWKKSGLITGREQGAITSCAARSK